LKTTEPALAFDAVPEIYDRIRPTYPDALFDELFSNFDAPLRILESGPGTGQATGSLTTRGAHITAVEPGPNMAEFLRARFAGNSQLAVVNAKFEDAVVDGPYDVVFAATSFHWIDASVRLHKAHDILRPGGAIAVVSTNQICSDADRGYFAACQPIYRKYNPWDKAPDLPTADDLVPAEFGEIEASDLFGQPQLFCYPWDQTYTTRQYEDLVRSYSVTNMMEPDVRESLITDLCALADREFGGHVTRPLVITLTLAFRD
jgi:SAM-dependent methyltransferase